MVKKFLSVMVVIAMASFFSAPAFAGAKGTKDKSATSAPAAKEEKVKDPVCGMEVAKGNFSFTYKNNTYYFCSQADLDKFKADPTAYVK